MQFQVPQFIETEAKIVGPLTLKQFLYIGAAAGLSFLFFFIFSFPLWIVLTTILAAIGITLAFVKINGRRMPSILRYALAYFFKPRLYLWKGSRTTLGATPKKKEISQKESGGALKNLVLAMTTTTRPIEKREKSRLFGFLRRSPREREQRQVLRHTSGEKEVARRVDYR